MSRHTVLIRGRVKSAVAFVDTCEITRVTGEVPNLTTGVLTQTRTIVYSGRCKFDSGKAPWAGPADVGEAALRLAAGTLHLPVVGTEGLLVDDRVECLTCVHDAELVGRFFSIVGQHHESYATARRLPIQEKLS